MKTPKQLKRWLYKARLRPCGWGAVRAARDGYAAYEGRGRVWRIVNGYLDMSCPIAEFDRWANSLEQRMILPTSEEDFVNTVKRISNNVH
jgi:hypothetical protein